MFNVLIRNNEQFDQILHHHITFFNFSFFEEIEQAKVELYRLVLCTFYSNMYLNRF